MPKEYTLIGGNGTRVSPLEVNESGTYEAGDSRAFNPVKVNVPSGSSTLSGLTDVDISNPTDGQVLVYNASSGKWENGAGGVLILHEIPVEANESNAKAQPAPMIRLDKTWQEIYDAGVCFVEQIYSWADGVYKKLLPVNGITTPDPEEGITAYTVEALDATVPVTINYVVNEGGANGYPERQDDK